MARRNKERRSHPRHTYEAPLHFRPSRLYAAQAIELSDTGIAFAAEAPVEPGCELELFLINKNVRIDGTVTYCLPVEGGQFRVGLQFEKPEPELVEVLTAAWTTQHE